LSPVISTLFSFGAARVTRLHTVVTCAALLMFAWLTMRHVGEAPFLEDQVYQLQNFESLLRLRPEGLWGPVLSGTVPPAHALGPLGAVVFGVPVALGLGIDSIHAATSLLIAIATAICVVVLARIDVVFAWLWLLVFAATGVVWWNAGILWGNTLLLPLGLGLASLAASCLRRPDRATLAWLVVTGVFALQLHLVAAVAAPLIVIVAAVTLREAPASIGRAQAWMLALAAVAAIGPYLMAEVLTGFGNLRAILGHLDAIGGLPVSVDVEPATMPLLISVDPTGLFQGIGLSPVPVIAVGAVLSAIALRLGAPSRHRQSGSPEDRSEWVLFWLTVCAVVSMAGQALFFWWMSRPFQGYHHVTLLTPFYAVVPAVLLRRALSHLLHPSHPSHPSHLVLGTVVLALLLVAGPSLADRFAPARTPWSYARIRAALDVLCGDAAVDTDEGPGFAARLNPQYDSVLRYMMRQRLTTCRYQPSSDVVIAATSDGGYPASKTIGQALYHRELVLPPGLARYRRSR
jgi:hypothetical protein